MTVTRLTRTGLHFGAGALAALLVVLIGTCSPNQQSSAGTPNSETYRQLDLFGQVFQRVREDYVETVDDQTLIHAALNGMLQALDPHSSYMSADQFEEMQVQTSGRFGGLGIEVTMENGFVKVVSPIDDTPAYRAGVLSGDLITHIDEEAVLGLTLSEAVDRMRGEPNTEIIIRVSRPGVEPFDVSIIREIIHVPVGARAGGRECRLHPDQFLYRTDDQRRQDELRGTPCGNRAGEHPGDRAGPAEQPGWPADAGRGSDGFLPGAGGHRLHPGPRPITPSSSSTQAAGIFPTASRLSSW